MATRNSARRRAGAAGLVIGAVLVAFAGVAQANPPSGTTVTGAATLKAAHVGSTNPGFGTGTCPANTTAFAGDYGWHFVFQSTGTAFVTVTANFDAAPHDDVTGGSDADSSDNVVVSGYAVGSGSNPQAFVADPDDKHAYVFTPGADYMLVSASATTQGTDPLDTEFNLSHVCAGTSVVTTVPTTVAPTTVPTTVAPTTVPTTVAPTTVPTTVAPTTVPTTDPTTTTTFRVLGTEVTQSSTTSTTGAIVVGGEQVGNLAFTGTSVQLFLVGFALMIVGALVLQFAGDADDPLSEV